MTPVHPTDPHPHFLNIHHQRPYVRHQMVGGKVEAIGSTGMVPEEMRKGGMNRNLQEMEVATGIVQEMDRAMMMMMMIMEI